MKMSAYQLLLTTLLTIICIFNDIYASEDKQKLVKSELIFLTWADYIDPQVIGDFERKFKVTVKPAYFETDDVRNDMLVETDGRGYDVVIVNSPAFSLYRKRGWLQPFDPGEIPNLKYMAPRWMNALSSAAGYGVPYAWGMTGIAYRTDLVPEPFTHWKQLFQPAEALRGKIMMTRNARDVIGMALKALGYSANSTAPEELAAAERLLLAQKPYVKNYAYVSLGADSELVTGQIAVAMMYSGDALQLRQHNPNISYVVPEEGGEIWIDYLAILATPQRQLALQFINFLQEPANAARNALFTQYATPNRAAERRLPPNFLHNPLIYPDGTVLRKSEFHAELPPRVAKQRNTLFARLLQQPVGAQ